MIPQEVRDHPAAALDDPRFAKPEGVREYFATFDDWTFNRPGVALEAVRVGFELLEFQERRGPCPKLRVLALKAKGKVYRRRDLNVARKAYDEAERIYREELPRDPLGLGDLFCRVGILERELGNWGESDRAHHLALSLVYRRDRHMSGVAEAAWGASKLERGLKTNEEAQFRDAFCRLRDAAPKLKQGPALEVCLYNLMVAETALGFPEETLEEAFLALRNARQAESTRTSGPPRSKLSYGVGSVRVPKGGDEMDVRFTWWQCILSVAGGRWRRKTVRVLEAVRLAFLDLDSEAEAATVALDEALTLALVGQWDQVSELLHWGLPLLVKRGWIAEVRRTEERLGRAVKDHRLVDLAVALGAIYCEATGFPKYPAAVAAGLV